MYILVNSSNTCKINRRIKVNIIYKYKIIGINICTLY